jgi:hypothetical protein
MMVDLVVLGLLGVFGICVFFVLVFQGGKSREKDQRSLEVESISIFGFVVAIAVCAYLVRLVVMVGTGLGADFVAPTIVTGGVALIPLVFLGIIGFWERKRG